MNVITFSGHVSSTDRSNSTAKTNSVSNQKIQAISPESKLIMPDSATLKVYFTGKTSPADSKARRFLIDYENELNDNKNAKLKTDFELGKVTLDDIKPGADLSGKNLIYFDFVKNNKMDISGSNLKETLLNRAILNNVTISDKKHKTDLTSAILNSAKLKNAKLSYAKLDKAHLHAADLTEADLTGTSIKSAQMNGTKFNKAVLNDVDLSYSWLIGAELNGAELKNVDLNHASLKWADFRNSWLLGANFEKSSAIEAAKFDGAYYNDKTKFPEEFDPDEHRMIFIGKKNIKEEYKNFKNQEIIEK
ncbi:MAG: pentapeptide repeat-containing protein [Candidatus Gastranaerophilales bacterium]|nr:pentapeptide repeat-containing protein [Candidatus Gastranaerophilales bacterium]